MKTIKQNNSGWIDKYENDRTIGKTKSSFHPQKESRCTSDPTFKADSYLSETNSGLLYWWRKNFLLILWVSDSAEFTSSTKQDPKRLRFLL